MGRSRAVEEDIISDDEEMASPRQQKKTAGRQSTSGSSKKKQKEPTPDEEDEEEGDDGENYEIEDILQADHPVNPKTNKPIKNKWTFWVSWKNYPPEENSWVPEEDFNDREPILKFWEAHPEIDGNPYYSKLAGNKGRKSGASSAANGSRVTKPRKSVKGEDESEDGSPRPAPKRKTSSKAEDDDDIVSATPDVNEDEEVRPKKKSKTSSVRKKEEIENGYMDSDPEDTTVGAGHDLNAMQKHMGKKNWEALIGTIETVERAEDGDLMVYFTATDGSKAICNSKVLRDKAPKQLLDFYEGHLRWRGGSPRLGK